MRLDDVLWEQLRVEPGHAPGLADRPTSGVRLLGAKTADMELGGFTAELAVAQEHLYASGSRALLIVLQGLDAAGKDGTIRHVMSGVNPQGCVVTSFKEPSREEQAHDFLWRAALHLPPSGYIGVFNRSYYEDVLVVRVHPDRLAWPPNGSAAPDAPFWRRRHDDINAFEHHLSRNGTQVVKFYLHLSKEEQRRRLLARLDDPTKHWKFSSADLVERGFWSDYQSAYEEVLTATSTKWAPWFVIPADDKHVARALVAGVMVRCLEGMARSPQPLSPEKEAAIDAARAQLTAE